MVEKVRDSGMSDSEIEAVTALLLRGGVRAGVEGALKNE